MLVFISALLNLGCEGLSSAAAVSVLVMLCFATCNNTRNNSGHSMRHCCPMWMVSSESGTHSNFALWNVYGNAIEPRTKSSRLNLMALRKESCRSLMPCAGEVEEDRSIQDGR